MYLRYRNINKRHMHARETEATLDNVRAADELVGKRTRQSNSRIKGANERQIKGAQNRGLAASLLDGAADNPEIGRASCRERVEISAVDATEKRNRGENE